MPITINRPTFFSLLAAPVVMLVAVVSERAEANRAIELAAARCVTDVNASKEADRTIGELRARLASSGKALLSEKSHTAWLEKRADHFEKLAADLIKEMTGVDVHAAVPRKTKR